MSSVSNPLVKQYGRLNSMKSSSNWDVFYPTSKIDDDIEAKRLASLIEWLNTILPNSNLSAKASAEELRAYLIDGTVLLQISNRLRPDSFKEGGGVNHSTVSQSENVRNFLSCMDELGIPKFLISDLEKGSMKPVIDCLLTLRAQFWDQGNNVFIRSGRSQGDRSPNGVVSPTFRDEKQKGSPRSRFQQAVRNTIMSEQSTTLMHHVGHKFHEVFQLKQGRYADLSAARISEMMKSNSLDNAPTQSLLSVVNGILDESIERKNGEIPHRVSCLLRKVVQEIERRISTQAEHLRTQNNLFKAREEKYQSRIRVLEALASGTGQENAVAVDQFQQTKIEKPRPEETKKLEGENMANLMKEKEERSLELSALKQELESAKKAHDLRCMQIETEAKDAKAILEGRLKELENLLEESRNKTKVLEAYSESKSQRWSKKEHTLNSFVEFQFSSLRDLRLSSQSIKHDVFEAQKSYTEELNTLENKLKALIAASENYYLVLAENRKLFNEIQDLKGNIRVYCRIRPFLRGQAAKCSTIEHIGETGELVVANPSKQGKESNRLFRFNKVYGPDSTQVEVFSDTQPLIRSVLDGYNICIFAYGQTGSGKTYTMTGPDGASEKDWGVNYRALNDLFNISQNRSGSFTYEVGVQMVEIYNEQVRDLLASDRKKVGISSTSQINGLAVPDATMQPVTSTSDVLELMHIGLHNRAVSFTAMNERSSRSHSVVSIHVRGKDLHNGDALYGNLHLVDLAGSERVDRSEVTGDRLKEAQHINKSLSALGDVIFALSKKSSHVPYRNSKLTQLLQSSLGGQAKTLMFVQINPDVESFSETLSTLKFAERVSGVELGAAKSSKEGRDVKELMDQVASLKDTIEKKDEEIERLQLLKHPGLNGKKSEAGVLRYGYSSVGNDSVGGKVIGLTETAASEQDSRSEQNEKHSEADFQQSMDDFRLKTNRFHQQSEVSNQDIPPTDAENGDIEERLSDTSDGALSAGREPDGLADEGSRSSDSLDKIKVASKVRSPQRAGQVTSRTVTVSRDPLKGSTSVKKATTGTGNSTLLKPSRKWQ